MSELDATRTSGGTLVFSHWPRRCPFRPEKHGTERPLQNRPRSGRCLCRGRPHFGRAALSL